MSRRTSEGPTRMSVHILDATPRPVRTGASATASFPRRVLANPHRTVLHAWPRPGGDDDTTQDA